jgi:hypothetical protein
MRDAMETTPKIRYHPPRPEQEPEYDARSLLRLHGGSLSGSALLTPLQRAIFRIGLLALVMGALIVVFAVLATT